jgi:hypothetical protein
MKSEMARTIFAVLSPQVESRGLAENGMIPIDLRSQVSGSEAFLGMLLNFSQSRNLLDIPHGFLLMLLILSRECGGVTFAHAAAAQDICPASARLGRANS